LLRWGRPFCASTTPAMIMAVVILPPAYSRNIALWSANGH
jgi:hypothetical protein